MEITATRRIPYSPRSPGHPADRSELPPRGMAPLGFCGAAQQSITSRKTRSTNSLERTFSAVPLQQTRGSHKRGCKQPFAFFVIGRPFAASRVYRHPQREQRVVSHALILLRSTRPSAFDLMRRKFYNLTVVCVSSLSACTTISTRATKNMEVISTPVWLDSDASLHSICICHVFCRE